jgi:hypothetical protein
MTFWKCDFSDREGCDFREGHCSVAMKPLVLGGNFSSAVCESPRRVDEDGAELLTVERFEERLSGHGLDYYERWPFTQAAVCG